MLLLIGGLIILVLESSAVRDVLLLWLRQLLEGICGDKLENIDHICVDGVEGVTYFCIPEFLQPQSGKVRLGVLWDPDVCMSYCGSVWGHNMSGEYCSSRSRCCRCWSGYHYSWYE